MHPAKIEAIERKRINSLKETLIRIRKMRELEHKLNIKLRHDVNATVEACFRINERARLGY